MSHHCKRLSVALEEMILVCLWTSVKAHTIVRRRLSAQPACAYCCHPICLSIGALQAM